MATSGARAIEARDRLRVRGRVSDASVRFVEGARREGCFMSGCKERAQAPQASRLTSLSLSSTPSTAPQPAQWRLARAAAVTQHTQHSTLRPSHSTLSAGKVEQCKQNVDTATNKRTW